VTLEPAVLEKWLGKTDLQVHCTGRRKISSFPCPSELVLAQPLVGMRILTGSRPIVLSVSSGCLESIFPHRHNLWALLSPKAADGYVGCRRNFLLGWKNQLLPPMGHLWASIAVVVATASKSRFVLGARDSVWGGIEGVFKDSKHMTVS